MEPKGPAGGPFVPDSAWSANLTVWNLRAACQVLVAVGRLPVARGNELRALKKLNASEIGLLQVGAIDKNLEKIAALKVRAFEIGAAEIGPAKIGILEVGAGKVGSLEVEAAKGGAGKIHAHLGLFRPPGVPCLGALLQ